MLDINQVQKTLSIHGYEFKKFIGQGTFSSVLLCQSVKYNHQFAIKRAIKHRLTEFEYNVLVSLNHPHIIRLYDSFYDDDAQYLVMEYCPNGTIKNKGALSYDKFIYYARQILEAIVYCHSKKIAHRDIKPDNIFLDEYDHIKIADFGLAKKFDREDRSTDKCGSLVFFSPEMIQCHNICPFKADIWALGVTFFFMATGSYPFQSDSREELKRLILLGDFNYDSYDIDPQIRYLICKMTSRIITSRPAAEKLLKFSLFETEDFIFKRSSILKGKKAGYALNAGYYTKISMYADKAIRREDEKQNSENNQPHRKSLLPNILSYRGINLYPNRPRVNTRVVSIKKV